MTCSNEELAKQLVASKHWHWMPRMADTTGWTFIEYVNHQRDLRTCAYGIEGVWLWSHSPGTRLIMRRPIEGRLPDLDDPATKGCLLALVREAWGDPFVCPAVDNTGCGWWVDGWAEPRVPSHLGDTEGEALAYALLSLYEEKE